MPNLNVELLRQRAREIREGQAALREYVKAGREEFLRNRQISDAAKYRLLLAIGASIAICNHFAARVANKAPAPFAECFEVLEEQSIISQPLCRKLTKCPVSEICWCTDTGKWTMNRFIASFRMT